MKLPSMIYNDKITRSTQIKFGDYRHSLYASEGDIYDMKNICSDLFPLIAPRLNRSTFNFEEIRVWSGEDFAISADRQGIAILRHSDDRVCKIGDVVSAEDIVKIEIEDEGLKKYNSAWIVKRVSNDVSASYYKVPEGDDYDELVLMCTNKEILFEDFSSSTKRCKMRVTLYKKAVGKSVNTKIEERYSNSREEGMTEEVIEYSEEKKQYIVRKTETSCVRIDESIEGVYYTYKITDATTDTAVTVEDVRLKPRDVGNTKNDKLYFTDSEGRFFYDNEYYGTLSKSDKSFAGTKDFIYISPDKMYFDIAKKTLVRSNHIEADQWRGTPHFSVGSNQLVINEPKILENQGASFTAGQAVSLTIKRVGYSEEIYGLIIKTVTSDSYSVYITFTEGVIKTSSEGWEGYSYFKLDDNIPDLKYVCAADNRVWGCDEKGVIYCTAFGKPFNWFDYSASDDGNVGDISWSVTPFDGGEITGCVNFQDTPTFFTENSILYVDGNRASNFRIITDDMPGIKKGSDKSLAMSDETLFYLSQDGVTKLKQYTMCLSENFYEHFDSGVGGCTGRKYYICLKKGEVSRLFVYDVKKGIWCVEDNLDVKSFFKRKGRLIALTTDGEMFTMDETIEDRKGIESFIEFGDYYCESPNKKGISKMLIRVSVEKGAELEFLINYNSEKNEEGERRWESVKKISATDKKSFTLPVIPHRCDHFRFKLKGTGGFVLYSLSYEYYEGSGL